MSLATILGPVPAVNFLFVFTIIALTLHKHALGMGESICVSQAVYSISFYDHDYTLPYFHTYRGIAVDSSH